ncbi:MAG: LysR family transcriptional regulator [Bacillota bacterium]
MDLSHLHVFCTVLETGSISNAARKLFVSQPTISMKINEMEEYYQVKLIERTNKGVKPTEQGLFLYQEGQKMLSMAKNLERHFMKPNSTYLEELHIGASGTIGGYFLPCKIIQFQELQPQFRILLNINNSYQIVMQMLNKVFDMGFVEGPLEDKLVDQCYKEGLAVDLLAEDELTIIANESLVTDGSDSLDWDYFRSLPLVLKNRGTGIRATVEKTLGEHGLSINDLNLVMEVNRIDAVISAVVAHKGVSLLPEAIPVKEKFKKFRLREFTFKHQYYIIYNPANADKHPFGILLHLFKDQGSAGLYGQIKGGISAANASP